MKTENIARPSWYFEPLGATRFLPTVHVGGGWNPDEQHIAPALGLLPHLVEVHRDARRQDGLKLGRVSFDIYGVLPMEACDVEIEVLRPGKTIELVEARLSHGGRVALTMRAWLLATMDTGVLAGSAYTRLAAPDTYAPWDMTDVWPGGYVRSVQLRRSEQTPGAATYWVNTDVHLVKDARVSPTARLLALVDVANGVTPRAAPAAVAFPNVDLTAHLLREPVGNWIGFDTKVSFGPVGLGITNSIIHDVEGPVAVVSQCLTVRPKSL